MVIFWVLKHAILEILTLQGALDVKFKVDGAALDNLQSVALILQLFNPLNLPSQLNPKFRLSQTQEVGHQTQEQQTLLLLCKLVRLILTLIMFSSLLKLTPLSHSPTLLRCKISSKQLSLLDLSQLFSATRETRQILIHLIV